MSLDEQAAFDLWRADRSNQAALESMHQLWGETAALKAGPRPAVRRGRLVAFAAGAAFAIALGASAVGLMRGLKADTAVTGVGEQRAATLRDGSLVSLNVATKLEYKLGRERRQIRMDQGEALFVVRKDPKRPFLVRSGPYEVRAVGTAFNVRARDNAVEVAVSEGVVEVRAVEGPFAADPPIKLAAGQRIRLEPSAPLARGRVAETPASAVAEWRMRTVTYEDVTVGELTQDLNRFFARPLHVEEPDLSNRRLTVRLQMADRRRTIETLAALVGGRILVRDGDDLLASDGQGSGAATKISSSR